MAKDTKERILTTAPEMFSQKGYEGSNIRELSASLGLVKLGLILVGAATLPDLFDPILLQYRMILRFFHLEDIGTVLVNGAKDKGDVMQGDGLKRAFEMGSSLASPDQIKTGAS